MSYISKRTGEEVDHLLDLAETALQKEMADEEYATKEDLNNVSFDDSEIQASIEEMFKIIGTHNKELKFFAIEPVVVRVGDKETQCSANAVSTVFVGDEEFEIIPTSNASIKCLLNYPIPLTWFEWLEGVDVFENIIFDMNTLEMSQKWTQYYQGEYHVQKAQYSNCIFWNDKPYTHSPFEERTNYTLYYSSQLPMCYAANPANTYKPFYFAYGVQNDPNWRNPDYINSFANLASGAPQTFSYYGAKAIGIYNYDVDIIALCKDCRGLMYDSRAIQHAGIFDASKTTNFGAKKGSWQEAFGKCYSLEDLYIKNLKTSINVSWSPINIYSIEYIVSNAINTSKIYIYVSPYTWNRCSEELKATATAKNIAITLLEGNMIEDNRTKAVKVTGDGTKYLAADGTYKAITMLKEEVQSIFLHPDIDVMDDEYYDILVDACDNKKRLFADFFGYNRSLQVECMSIQRIGDGGSDIAFHIHLIGYSGVSTNSFNETILMYVVRQDKSILCFERKVEYI